MTKYEKAIKEMEDMIADYKWTHDRDPGMLEMYKNDRNDFRSIVRFLKRGDWKKAYEKAYYLDTAARDNIPDTTYTFMHVMHENFVDM